MKKFEIGLMIACFILGISALNAIAAPPSDDFQLVYSDEFEDPNLNMQDWEYRTGTKYEGVNQPSNVFVEDGKLKIKFDKEDIGGKPTYTGGGIISNTLFGYGYYEVKSKLFGTTGGFHSSFWTAGGDGGDGIKLPLYNGIMEIDVYEQDSHKPENLAPNLHYWIGTHTTDPKNKIPYETFDSSKQEFTVGLLYLPDRIEWYINGQLTTTVSNPKIYAPQRVWITSLANTVLSGKIDDSLLPGYSEWEYFRFYTIPLKGTNLIANDGFEMNDRPYYEKKYPLQTPVAWYEKNDIDAAQIVYDDEVYDGHAFLKHASDKPYNTETYQKLTNIPNGKYTLSAYVRSTNGQEIARMYANDKEVKINSASWDKWTKIVLEDVIVTDNYCEIGFESKGDSSQKLAVDNVSFMLTDEGTDEYNIKVTPDFNFKAYYGEILVDENDANCKLIGNWLETTTIRGYKGYSKYSNDEKAEADYNIPIEKDGEYVVQLYKLYHQNSDNAAALKLAHSQGTYETTINMAEGKSEWVTLGSFNFKKSEGVSLKLIRAGGYLRADCVRVIPKASIILDNAILLKIGNRKAFVKNEAAYIDKEDLKVTPIIENDKTMVPLRFIAESLGTRISYDDESQTITISQADKNISFKIGSNIMKINDTEVPLETPVIVLNDRTFVPLRAIGEAFNKKVYWSKFEHIAITDEPISDISDIDNYLEQRLK